MYADDAAVYNSGPSLELVLNIMRSDMALILIGVALTALQLISQSQIT